MSDCGLRTDGTCSLAGTKYCDWSCDVRDYIEEEEREFNDGRFDVSGLGELDAIFCLGPNSFSCVVPIERPQIMSITRFYIYQKGPHDHRWRQIDVFWMWGGPT